MKKSPLRALLGQVELIYRREKQMAQYFRELQLTLPDGIKSNSISRDAEENKTQCERLEGLISIIQTNLQRKLSSAETRMCVEYCSELLHRFTMKHAALGYENVMESTELLVRKDILEVLESVRPGALVFQE
jgi:hypothetical protein